jgi:aspartate aminotransferase-like enzyme
MAPCTKDQKVFVIKISYFSGYFVAMASQYRLEISVHIAPWRDTICRVVKLFEEAGSLCNKRVVPT